jgi:hypothetical protein
MSSAPSQTNAQPQPAPIVLTIPTQNDTQSEKEHITKLFPKKYILTFSVIQLSCAALAAILQMFVIGFSDGYHYSEISHVGTGIWAGFLAGISGGLGLFASHRPSNGTIIAFMVLNIISVLFVLPLLVFAGIGFGGHRRNNTFSIMCYGIQIVIGLLQGVVAITASAFSCRAVCCRRQHPGAVIFSPGTNAEQTFTTIPLNQIIQSTAQSAPPAPPATNLAETEEGHQYRTNIYHNSFQNKYNQRSNQHHQ